MNVRKAGIALIVALVVASFLGWMFLSEDPPPEGEPEVIEAG
jgi:hypothetical protein